MLVILASRGAFSRLGFAQPKGFEMKAMPSMLRPGRRSFSLAALAATWMLIAASSAQASTVTIGSPLTAAFASERPLRLPCTYAQTELPGAVVTSPSDGTIVRWRIKAAAGPGGFKLRVLHPAGFDAETGAGTSAEGKPVSFGTQVFTTDLPIHAGDLIGIDNTDASEEIGTASTSGSIVAVWIPTVRRRLDPWAQRLPIGPSSSHSTPMSNRCLGSRR